MTLTTKKLRNLTRRIGPTGADIMHLYSAETGKDHYVLVSDLLTGQSYDTWDPEESYDTGERVTYGFKLWESLIDDNEGNIPSEGANWKEVSESANPDHLERTILKVAHGFAAKDILTLDGSGALVKVSDPSTDKFIGIVIEVVDANSFRLGQAGYITGLSGLTVGVIHYAQADGTLSTLETDMPVLKADTLASGYILSSGGGGGSGMAIEATYADVAALLADQSNQDEDKWYLVQDASADITVDAGWAIYQYLGTTVGNLTDYLKVAEQESLDLTISDASETVKGIVEEATDAEVTAGTSVGGTGAKLFVNPAKLITWWTSIKAAAQTIAGFWTFGKVKTTHTAFGYATLTDAANIAWNADTIGNIAQITLGGNRTLDAITNPQTGAIYILRVVQDGTGNRTLDFNAAYTFPNSVTPYLNLTATTGVTVFAFFYDGTNFRYILPNGTYRLFDLLLENQKVASGKKILMYLDDTGKINKTSWIEFDTTNNKMTITGVNDSSGTASFEVVNQSGNSIIKVLNGRAVEIGGPTFAIIVDSSVSSGSAYIELNSNQSQAFKFVDKAGNVIEEICTTTGDLFKRIFQPVKFDQLSGNAISIFKQFQATVTASAGGTTTIGFVDLVNEEFIDVKTQWIVVESAGTGGGCNVNGTAQRNSGGTVSLVGSQDKGAGERRTAGGTWLADLIADDTNKRINFRFTNNTGTGLAFKVTVNVWYTKTIEPA